MPSAVVQSTVPVSVPAESIVTSNARLPTVSSNPAGFVVTLAVGLKPVSSIVPVAMPSFTVTFIGFERVTVNVSSISATPSSTTGTETVASVSPGAKVTVPAVVV